MIHDESHIFPIATDYTIDIYISHGQNFKEVVKVATFTTLVQCTEFGAHQFVQLVGQQFGMAFIPLAFLAR